MHTHRSWSGAVAAAAVAAAALVVPGAASSPALAHDGPQLPNISPLPADDIRIDATDDGSGLALRFSSWMANIGDHHFDMVGIPRLGVPVLASAMQCVAWAAPRVCHARQEIGTLEYHSAHGHWHFQDFARYELRRASDGSVVQVSDKVSFCMMDSAPVRNGRSVDALVTYPLYVGCDLGTQGISAGWADIYDSSLVGQQLPLAGVPDGEYDVVIVADPSGLILETDDSDNVSTRRVVISGGGTEVSAP